MNKVADKLLKTYSSGTFGYLLVHLLEMVILSSMLMFSTF